MIERRKMMRIFNFLFFIVMKRIVFAFLLMALFTQAMPQNDYVTIQTKSSYSGGWSNRQTKLVSLIPGYTSVTDGTDDFTYTGMYKHLRTDSTGFFYVKKIDDRWWMVDPDGYAGINMAVTSFTGASIQNNYDLIRRNGYNGIGSFLANEDQTRDIYNSVNYNQFSYTRRLNFFLSYKNVRHNYYSTPTSVRGSLDHILVLDPKFAEYCDELAQAKVLPYVDERYLLGWFTDNEINFNQDQLRHLVRDLEPGDPSREAAMAFATSKGLTESDVINYTSKVTEAIKQEFATLLAEHYYKTVSEAIRKYDPNHLILGSRLHGRPRAIMGVVTASHKYMDVTSVNFYDRFTPNEQIALATWTQDHPVIVGEVYIKDINAFNTSQPGAGWYVNSQAHRGYFYQNFALELLRNKCYVGWHYFRFQDDPDSNKGMVTSGNNPQEYVEMTAFMEELNKQVYRLADHFDNRNRRPQLPQYTRTVKASEDTWVLGAASNSENHGSSTELEVYYSWSENNRKEAFLKFNLGSLGKELPNLKNATLQLHVTTANGANRTIFISAIHDNSWDENTLTGAIRATNENLRTTGNRLFVRRGAHTPGMLSFDITTWLADNSHDSIFSFKVHDLAETTAALRLASREHSDVTLQPVLVLTFWGEDAFSNTLFEEKIPVTWNVNQNRQLSINYPGNPFNLYRVFGVNGQLLLRGNLTRDTIDVSPLQSGLYILQLTGKENSALKFIIP
jgi:hypothetical protein